MRHWIEVSVVCEVHKLRADLLILRDVGDRDLVEADEVFLVDLVVMRKVAALVVVESLLCLLDDAGGQLFVGLLRTQLVRVPHRFDKQAREQVNWLSCQAVQCFLDISPVPLNSALPQSKYSDRFGS